MATVLERLANIVRDPFSRKKATPYVTLGQRWKAKALYDPKKRKQYLQRILGNKFVVREYTGRGGRTSGAEIGKIYVKRKGESSAKFKPIDPKGFDLGDIGDVAREAVGAVGDVAGAGLGAVGGFFTGGVPGAWVGGVAGSGLGYGLTDKLTGKITEKLTGVKPTPSSLLKNVGTTSALSALLGPVGIVPKTVARTLGKKGVKAVQQGAVHLGGRWSRDKLFGIPTNVWRDFWDNPSNWTKKYKTGYVFKTLRDWKKEHIDKTSQEVRKDLWKTVLKSAEHPKSGLITGSSEFYNMIDDSVNEAIVKEGLALKSKKGISAKKYIKREILDAFADVVIKKELPRLKTIKPTPYEMLYKGKVPKTVEVAGKTKKTQLLVKLTPRTLANISKKLDDDIIYNPDAYGRSKLGHKFVSRAAGNLKKQIRDILDFRSGGRYGQSLKQYGEGAEILKRLEKIVPKDDKKLWNTFMDPESGLKAFFGEESIHMLRDMVRPLEIGGNREAAKKIKRMLADLDLQKRKLQVSGMFYRGPLYREMGAELPGPGYLLAKAPMRYGGLTALVGADILNRVFGDDPDGNLISNFLQSLIILRIGTGVTAPRTVRFFKETGERLPGVLRPRLPRTSVSRLGLTPRGYPEEEER